MSVMVKNMTMPTDCRECRLMEYHNSTGKTWCTPADGLLTEDFKPIPFDGRPEWCPLVELPEKHGRLFDTDEVVKCLEELPDNDEKAWAIGLVEWAIAKRWCIEAEGEG